MVAEATAITPVEFMCSPATAGRLIPARNPATSTVLINNFIFIIFSFVCLFLTPCVHPFGTHQMDKDKTETTRRGFNIDRCQAATLQTFNFPSCGNFAADMETTGFVAWKTHPARPVQPVARVKSEPVFRQTG